LVIVSCAFAASASLGLLLLLLLVVNDGSLRGWSWSGTVVVWGRWRRESKESAGNKGKEKENE
jgi:hypothetical protein